MTEPDTGSDALALTTTARHDGGRVELDGVKTFVTNAPAADVVLVFATSDRALGWAGIDAYVVARETPGLSVGPPMRTMHAAAAPMADVLLERCVVTTTDRVGPPGSGMALFTYALELERSLLAAGQLGLIGNHLDTLAMADAAISRARWASLSARLRTSRMLVHRATARLDEGRKAPRESSLAKLSTSELWSDVARCVVDDAGPAGMLESSSGLLGDGVAGRIYSGTSELQREILGHRLGLR
jgi:alkylation response protein AidB-like acyl-CoA dehydrogenase